jgi:hypothetical protein
MTNLTEKQMRLLAGIVLDAADIARKSQPEEDSKEMQEVINIIQLAKVIVNMTNELYPVVEDEQDRAIKNFFGI